MNHTGMISYNPVALLSAQTLEHDLDMAYATALTLFEHGDIPLALNHFVNICRKAPDLPGICYAIAVCCARLGKWLEASSVLQEELQRPHPHSAAQSLKQDIERLMQQLPATTALTTSNISDERCVTIFTMPKPFKGHANIIQRNAIQSWKRMVPEPEIILMGNEYGTSAVAAEFGLRHIPHVACNEYGTPLVNSIFSLAQLNAASSIVAFVNTDIILFSSFMNSVQAVAQTGQNFLMVGRRFDVGVWEELDFNRAGWDSEILDKARHEGLLHEATGVDYFVFRTGFYEDIPPFAIGRTAWDNWLVWYAYSKNAAIVDASRAAPIVHQDHDYGHVKGGVRNVWYGDESSRNIALAANKMLNAGAARLALNETFQIVDRDGLSVLSDPTPEDYARVKMQQAKGAFDRGLVSETLDLLEYIDLFLNLQPFGYHFLKARCYYVMGDSQGAWKELEQELALYADNKDAKRMLTFLEIAMQKSTEMSTREPMSG